MLNTRTQSPDRLHISIEDLKDLARGAAFLGTGGGGDPYIGRLMAEQAIQEFGMPEIISTDDLDDDAAVFTAAMVGAPTVMLEKGTSGEDIDLSIKRLAEVIGRQPDAISPIEIGASIPCYLLWPRRGWAYRWWIVTGWDVPFRKYKWSHSMSMVCLRHRQ